MVGEILERELTLMLLSFYSVQSQVTHWGKIFLTIYQGWNRLSDIDFLLWHCHSRSVVGWIVWFISLELYCTLLVLWHTSFFGWISRWLVSSVHQTGFCVLCWTTSLRNVALWALRSWYWLPFAVILVVNSVEIFSKSCFLVLSNVSENLHTDSLIHFL